MGKEDESHHPVPEVSLGWVKDWPLTGAQWPPHSCPHPGSEHNPGLTTPSSAGALSPTTSITGQLRTHRGRVVWPGQGWGGGGGGGGSWGRLGARGTHRRVLAFGTVPGRLMSRSLRLRERERQNGHSRTGRGCSQASPIPSPSHPTPSPNRGN